MKVNIYIELFKVDVMILTNIEIKKNNFRKVEF